jgi:hypothetical protein
MAVNPIIECFSRDLVTEYCQDLESSAVYTVPPFILKTLPGRSNRRLPRLPLNIHAEAIILPFLIWNINIGLCLSLAITLTRLQSYEMFEVLLINRINRRVVLRGILNFRLRRNVIPYQLARGIPLKEGVP